MICAQEMESEAFNLQTLLPRCMHRPSVCATMLNRFCTIVVVQAQLLRDTARVGDMQALSRLAHTVKGSAAAVSAEPLRKCAEHLEKSALIADPSAIEQDLALLNLEVQRCVATLPLMLNQIDALAA